MIKEELLRLKESEKFDRDYGYLVHFFAMLDENLQNVIPWEIGYYSTEKDLIKVYRMGDEIEIAEDKANKEAGKTIEELKLDEVNADFPKIKEIILDKLGKEYASHPLMKSFVLLQKKNGKAAWNVTLISKTFNIIHLLIDAANGNILEDKIETLLSWNANSSFLKQNQQ